MRRHFSPVKLLACDDILFIRETVNVLLAELESNQLEEIIFPDGFFSKVDVDTHHIVPVIASSNWCYQGHCLDFLDIQLWRISHINRTSDMIHPEWTHNSRLMNQNFIQKYGQIIGSWLFQNWICRIVTIFLEFFADGSSQRIRQLFRNIRVLECQISNRFQFFSAQIYDDQFRFIMKRAERFNATTRVNNYHFSFGAWTFK